MNWNELRQVHSWLPVDATGWHQHRNGGGWVQDTCQVDGSAKVCDSAVVCGSAEVCDSAVVCGSAEVCGSALVCGSAVVCEGKWAVTPLSVTGVLPWTISVAGPDVVAIGCEYHTLDEWEARAAEFTARHDIRLDELVETWLPIFRQWFAANKIEPTHKGNQA